jgi:putative FmdB family regulatory protein
MPRYDYRCHHCGHEWEQQLLIDDRNEPLNHPCAECGDTAVERYLPSAPGVGYTVGGNSLRKKTPEAFKDILRNIKSKHRGSVIDV